MRLTEQFRGEHRDRFVVKPIDPERAHRFVEQAVGRAGTCVFCGRSAASDYHDPDARQYTVDVREGEDIG